MTKSELEKLFDTSLLRKIGLTADQYNIPVFAVGGYVRDRLLGKRVKDIDFVVVGDGPSFARNLAKKLGTKDITIYKNFGTAMLIYRGHVLEIVGARKESYRGESRKPTVAGADLMTDLARRDFTINAIAIGLNADNYLNMIDPFNGKKDLKERILRTPLEPKKTFYDDPLRILRAVRFACRLHFRIDDDTRTALESEKDRLRIISQERITEEILKILSDKRPSIGFRMMEETGILAIIMPEISDLKGIDQVGKFRHKDIFEHTLKVLDNVARASDNINLRFVALFHDIAKPLTKEFRPSQGWTFHGHEEIGARMMTGVGKRLKLSKELIAYAEKLIRLHLRPIHLAEDGVTDSAIRRLIFQAGDEIDDLITLCRADITSGNPRRVARHLANFDLVVKRVSEVEERDRLRQFQPPVRGDEIMMTFNIPAGPLIGKIKKAIEEAILNGDIPNEHDAAFDYMLKIKDQFFE